MVGRVEIESTEDRCHVPGKSKNTSQSAQQVCGQPGNRPDCTAGAFWPKEYIQTGNLERWIKMMGPSE